MLYYFNSPIDCRDKHIDSITKVNYILIHHLLDILNATETFKIHSTWGYRNKTTSQYNGLIGDLQRGVAEISGKLSIPITVESMGGSI